MGLQVVGAGVGRTGTHSLKVALERLLGGPCYHMAEVLMAPERAEVWAAATRGEAVDWDEVFDGYRATVDWPGASFWREISAANPDAVVLLSTRRSADEWHRSADRTILDVMRRTEAEAEARDGPLAGMAAMTVGLVRGRFCDRLDDADALRAAYERHNAAVRAAVPAHRLVEWQPADGWGPLCSMLGVAEPDDPFPVTNTTEDFRLLTGLDG